MEEVVNKLKKAATKSFKKVGKIILIACVVFLIISACFKFIIEKDGSYKAGDKSNTPYAVETHTGNVSIDDEGNLKTALTAQELWDQMLKDGSRVDKYLDGPEELQKLITAQMVTDYIDTRPNPDEEIDWESFNKDVDSGNVQGIIKLKRAKSDGTISTLTFVDPETFDSYIEQYNSTGSEEDKQIALSHFTLEKGYLGSNIGTGPAIAAGTTITIPEGLGSVHTYMGWQLITDSSSRQYKLREQAGMTFDSEGFGRINGRYVIACTTTFGRVGDYIDFYQEDGTILKCIIGDIKSQGDPGCTEWGHNNGHCIVEFVVDVETWYNCGHPNPGTQNCHPEWNQNLTHAINGGSYFDNPTFGSDEGGETITNEPLKWPTDGTTITSYFGLRDQPTEGASTNHGGIDIGVPTGTNIYATEAGTVIGSGASGSGGNVITIDHGNGYVTKYMHCSELIAKVGDKVEKGQVIAKAGNTGVSTGPHLHFQIEFNGTKVDPLSFKYDNGMGDGVGGFGANSEGTSTTSVFYAKVARWNETTEIIESNDPEQETKNETIYNMTSTKINYQQMISMYKMPFDYLWALLVTSQDKDFVFELADLVYDSEIDITVHDNLTITTDVATDKYTRVTKVKTHDIKVNVYYGEFGENRATVTGQPDEGEITQDYTTITTNITKTNTLDVKVTKADVWIVKYTQDFTYQQPEETSNPVPDVTIDDEEYPENPDKTDNIDTLGIAEAARQKIQAEYQYYSYDSYATAIVRSLQSDYYYKIINRTISTENTTQTTKYISSPATIEEKTDKESEEPNFVTIFINSNPARSNILSIVKILVNILEKSPDTVDMIDLTKYLLYKAVGRDYGVTEFDFSIFEPGEFKDFDDWNGDGNGGGGSSNIEGVPGQIYDFLLSKGVPPAGAAAILGNIENESSFNPEATNGTHTGLCQWSNEGRFEQLKEYANSKSMPWSDVITQMEFMWMELENTYTSVKNVIMSATEFEDLEYATWYFGRHFEVYFLGDYESTRNGAEQQERFEAAKKWYNEWEEKHSGGTIYYQNDYAHVPYGSSNIANCGCGPTCFAMVASDYTGKKITPEDAVSWCGNTYYVSGVGTSWSYFAAATKHFKLPANCVNLGNNINKAIAELQKGNLVISSQSEGLFTSGGHFILLSSITSEGRIMVRDPNKNNAVGKDYNNRQFTPNEISRSAANYWSFQKTN